MTLTGVSEAYGMPLDTLYVMIGAERSVPPETAMKVLEKLVPGMEVWAVREGVAAYPAGAWTPDMGRFDALGVLPAETQSSAPPEPTLVLQPVLAPLPTDDHIPQGLGEGTGSGLVLPQDGSRLAGGEVRGRMTLLEVVDYCQVLVDYLLAELGLAQDVDLHLSMRDLASQIGVEIQAVRDVVTRYQEQH
jgi:hypothetical protein